MRIIMCLWVCVVSLGMGNAWAGDVSAVNTKGIFSQAAIKGYDAVAFWLEKAPRKGSKAFTVEWHGATWHFSSQANKALFQKTPDKYAPQYGGYCAWAMADGNGRAVNIDPEAWAIYNDKLYLNYNLAVKEEWLKTQDQDIRTADNNYPGLTDVKQYTQ